MSASGVREARVSHRLELARLRALLWPEGPLDERLFEIGVFFRKGMNGTLPGAILVAELEGGELVGFLEAGLRSHADGCDTAQPVGYIEGWFVEDAFRRQGIAGS